MQKLPKWGSVWSEMWGELWGLEGSRADREAPHLLLPPVQMYECSCTQAGLDLWLDEAQ